MPAAYSRGSRAQPVFPAGASEFGEETGIKVGVALGPDEYGAADVRILRAHRERNQPDPLKLH